MTANFICPLCKELTAQEWAYISPDFYAPGDAAEVCAKCAPYDLPNPRPTAWERFCAVADADPVSLVEGIRTFVWVLGGTSLVVGVVIVALVLLGAGGTR